MKLSVVTPNYNGGRFLEPCIKSIISQRSDSVELEYIVMDGGSTDDSLEILDRYRDQIDLVRSESDNGPADAINKGFAHATGDLFAWLNADDIYHPDALSRVVKAMEQSPRAALLFPASAASRLRGACLKSLGPRMQQARCAR